MAMKLDFENLLKNSFQFRSELHLENDTSNV